MPVEVKGVRELIFDLRAFPDKVRDGVINRLSQIAYDSAQKGAGRHVVTGALFQSVFNRPSPGGRTVGHDQQRAPHAKWVIWGWRERKIVPTKKKALRWADGGRFFFSKGHMIGPYEGDPYMDRAADDALRQFNAILNEEIGRAI